MQQTQINNKPTQPLDEYWIRVYLGMKNKATKKAKRLKANLIYIYGEKWFYSKTIAETSD